MSAAYSEGWLCTQVFEGHSHYVMQAAFNPKVGALYNLYNPV